MAIGVACLAVVWAALFQAKENRNSARIWWRVLLVLGLLGAAWLVVSGVEPRADSLAMSEIAQRWIRGDYSDFDTGEYLFCYPYQLGYGLLLDPKTPTATRIDGGDGGSLTLNVVTQEVAWQLSRQGHGFITLAYTLLIGAQPLSVLRVELTLTKEENRT